MFQEILALIIIFLFIARISWQLHQKLIPRNQFIFWLFFWVICGILIVYIKKIDALVAGVGFSSSGIQVLLYIAVALIFYFIFRIRLKLEKIESDISTLTHHYALQFPKIKETTKESNHFQTLDDTNL